MTYSLLPVTYYNRKHSGTVSATIRLYSIMKLCPLALLLTKTSNTENFRIKECLREL